MAEPIKTVQMQDVVAPPQPPVVTTLHQSAPNTDSPISMHQNGMATRDVLTSDTHPLTEEAKTTENKLVSNTATTVTPPTAIKEETVDTTKETGAESADELTEQTVSVSEESNKEDTPQTETPPAPQEHSIYEAHDSLPDASAVQTTELTNTMQGPRIYDTTEYVVPIKDTMHTHGHLLGSIIAGVVSATIILAIIVSIALFVV